MRCKIRRGVAAVGLLTGRDTLLYKHVHWTLLSARRWAVFAEFYNCVPTHQPNSGNQQC